jgi:hypothetical protein
MPHMRRRITRVATTEAVERAPSARRRWLLLAMLISAGSACVRPGGRPAAVATPVPPDPRLQGEALGMLSDAQETLQVFDAFAAFRISTAIESGLRTARELPWDPPSIEAWRQATQVARSLRGRADRLFLAVADSRIEAGAWRERRSTADAAHSLIGLGDALAAYRDRVDFLSPGGDGTGAIALLDEAWQAWERSAAAWGQSRTESIGCAAP